MLHIIELLLNCGSVSDIHILFASCDDNMQYKLINRVYFCGKFVISKNLKRYKCVDT